MLDLSGFEVTQSSTNYGAGFAIDGNTNSDFMENDIFNSTTCTHPERDPWWQVDLEKPIRIDHIIVWNRTDGNAGFRLNNYILEILDKSGKLYTAININIIIVIQIPLLELQFLE